MAIPVYFSSVNNAINRDIASSFQYGILYGIMIALALYNLVLFIFIRQKEYGLYSLYLLGFFLNSLSYTGQLHTIITYDFGPYFQDWLDIFLMITYSVAGLHFARLLLKTSHYAPNLDRFVVRTTIVIPTAMVIGFIFDQLFFSMILAFILNTCFVILFVAMGIRAWYANKPFALIFICSSVTAAICITISTLAVAGFIVPYNEYTFKAIEVGMAFEAILLAVILARQFRMAQLDKLIAETYARTDSLTQLNNRRGFQDLTQPIWQNIIRGKKDVSIVLIDIDFFKRFNDQYGHDIGDKVLKEVAKSISNTCRKGDICARWGGEEFIVFLPETPQKQALLQAERIRTAIESLEVNIIQLPLSITASIGVSGTENYVFNNEQLTLNALEPIINQADRALYAAKQKGKNQVCGNK
jgi:diguanylate cyclase (GGDEF)-like protein